MYYPLNYKELNLLAGHISPSSEKMCNNYTYNMWFRSLFQRAQSKIKIKNLPEEWKNEDILFFIYYILLIRGYGCVGETKKFGVFFQPCTLSGYNFYYMPTKAIVTNPLMTGSNEFVIHKNCEIVRLTPDYLGIYDIIDNYARKLSLISESVDVSLFNSKTPYILGGKTKGVIQALKKIVDKVNEGSTSIFYNTRIGDAQKETEPFQHIELFNKDNYIVSDLLKDYSTILSQFDSEIGIKNNNFEKKERLITDEVNANNEDTLARCNIWVDTLNDSFELVNQMFGFNLKAELNNEELENEQSENNINRNVSL